MQEVPLRIGVVITYITLVDFSAGTVDASGGCFLYGDTHAGSTRQLYRLQVNGGSLQTVAVGAVGDGNLGTGL